MALYGGCKTYKHNTKKVKRDRPSEALPLISVSALLKLAEWYETYFTIQKGAERCENLEKVGFPPATQQAAVTPRADLGKATRLNSTPNPAALEPDRATTPPANTEGSEGG